MAKAVADTSILFWDGGCIFLGSASAAYPVHAHQAIQICFGRGGDILLRASDEVPWKGYPVGIIASQQPHGFDARAVTVGAVVFVEPETVEGRALTELYLTKGIATLNVPGTGAAIDALLDAFLAREGEATIVDATRDLIRLLTRGVAPAVITDERIARSIAYINANLDRAVTLDEVAGQVFLSPGRFRHLFVEQTGMGLRPYILWRRFMHIWKLIMSGRTISFAAHEAGFADSAHLTRTSRRMIGLAPSMLRATHSPASVTQAPAATPT